MRELQPEAVRFLYVEERLSIKEVARRLKTNRVLVAWYLGAAGIPLRDPSAALKGVPKSEEHRRKLAENLKKARAARTEESKEKQRQKMLGRTPPNKGIPWSEKTRANHAYRQTDEYRERQAARQRGELGPNWRGGISTDEHRKLSSWQWKARRRECYERDGWHCADCKVHCTSIPGPTRIQAHHIVPRREGGGDELENLVTLCTSCHHKREHLLRKGNS